MFTSGIRSILEDSRGNIWFGSVHEGAALYDGDSIIYFSKKNTDESGTASIFNNQNSLSDNQVRSIYEDQKGDIWIEGGMGISHYDGKRMSTRTDRYYGAKEDWQAGEHDIWFKANERNGYDEQEGHPGVYRYDGDRLTYHIFPVELKAGEQNYYSVTTPFIKGKDSILWFGTYGAVIGYDGSDFTIIDNESLGLTKETGWLHIRIILEDSKGHLWIGNNGMGVLRYDGENTIDFTAQHNLAKDDTEGNHLEKVFSIGEDSKGNIWFGTSGSGVWRYDGDSLTNYTREHGLDSNHIWTIYTSKDGELWFGGAEPSGVYVFDGSSFERRF